MPASSQLQLLGHASFRITTPEGRVILLDPWLTDNPFVPAELREPERADLVLITHGHDDHFDSALPALLARTGARIVAPAAVRFYLYEQGVPAAQFEPMNVGGGIDLLDLRLTMTLAQHAAHVDLPGNKTGFRHEAVGYILALSDGVVVYCAGDTALFGDMQLLAELYQPTVALLPIGDRYTMGPREAAVAARLLGVRHVVPFHYGTFASLVGTPEQLRQHLPPAGAVTVHALQAGETLSLSRL
ncbi:metal-dependent hydrolase [Hymenobacter chitinivorans]|uniref:L-ascorbate metabolism protein UlaG (Beta-lactamase superfamily) n=1 Tax=Hymenobacter chitinivorans DSM 11115 TaxID=1121954 RepID=A0A2M9AQA5_9BACT|nr:metal-dependent hydrolase [Hymenobacter chitinivorans]PJJ47887.1 L-ascorbate metabolism protein UlaG (beta-lactamase superfamily) [Hymenobacter chitinivorans DSM 11115]